MELKEPIDLRRLCNGGTIFEIEPPLEEYEDLKEGTYDNLNKDDMQGQFNFDCLNVNNNEDQCNKEPFELLAEKMFNLTDDGKIKKRILQEGYGKQPEWNDIVELDYNAYVEYNGEPFDSTYLRKKKYFFKLNGEGIIGFVKAVKSMRINEKSQFLIHPDLAYKDSGLNRIPPNSVVLFEIVLYSALLPTTNDCNNVSDEFEAVKVYIRALLSQAKEVFMKKDYYKAYSMYKKSLFKLENSVLENYRDQVLYDEFSLHIHTNILICCNLLGYWKRGCFHANQIYQLSKNGVVKIPTKVYFNNAKCLLKLNSLTDAMKKLEIANEIEPDNMQILNEIQKVKKMFNYNL